MTDIVERLRNDQGIGIGLTLCREAADEIERLREALRYLLACPAIADGNHGEASWHDSETVEAERIARAALEEKTARNVTSDELAMLNKALRASTEFVEEIAPAENADEIERLRAQVAALREALAKIAGMNQLNVTNYDRGRQQWDFQAIASAALEGK